MKDIWLITTNGFGGSGKYICIVYSKNELERDNILKSNNFYVNHLSKYEKIGISKTKKKFLSILCFDDPEYEG